MNRYLKALYDASLLRFDWQLGEWTYDQQGIVSTTVADNAAQLMAASLSRLEPGVRRRNCTSFSYTTIQLLRPLLYASCIGVQFSLTLLATVSEISQAQARHILLTLADMAFVFELDMETHRFCHDIVHAAAYSLLSNEEKQRLHYRIGWTILRQQDSPLSSREAIFEAVAHLNRGLSLVTERSECLQLAELELSAASQASKSLSHATARECASVGVALLSLIDAQHHWVNLHKLSFGLYLQLAARYRVFFFCSGYHICSYQQLHRERAIG